jgi:hypothetical protein
MRFLAPTDRDQVLRRTCVQAGLPLVARGWRLPDTLPSSRRIRGRLVLAGSLTRDQRPRELLTLERTCTRLAVRFAKAPASDLASSHATSRMQGMVPEHEKVVVLPHNVTMKKPSAKKREEM